MWLVPKKGGQQGIKNSPGRVKRKKKGVMKTRRGESQAPGNGNKERQQEKKMGGVRRSRLAKKKRVTGERQ